MAVWIFTDVKTRSTTYTIGQFESSLSSGMVKISQNNDSIRYEDKEKGIVAVGF